MTTLDCLSVSSEHLISEGLVNTHLLVQEGSSVF